MLGITAWIAFRFRVSFALGSIVATFHDVLVTLAFLAFFQYEMSLNVIAAMLTMVGYSMNDMIVIFDRVRENTRLQRREPLESAINTSLNQTLTRTVITSGTVFMAVLALFLFGGEVLQRVCVHDARRHHCRRPTPAGSSRRRWRSCSAASRPARRRARSRPQTAAAAPQQPSRKSKSQRKARAS